MKNFKTTAVSLVIASLISMIFLYHILEKNVCMSEYYSHLFSIFGAISGIFGLFFIPMGIYTQLKFNKSNEELNRYQFTRQSIKETISNYDKELSSSDLHKFPIGCRSLFLEEKKEGQPRRFDVSTNKFKLAVIETENAIQNIDLLDDTIQNVSGIYSEMTDKLRLEYFRKCAIYFQYGFNSILDHKYSLGDKKSGQQLIEKLDELRNKIPNEHLI